MAFMMTMPSDFKVGETRDCRINMKPTRLTWRDKDHLVIEPGDVRRITFMDRDGDLISFVCTDADGTAPHVTTAVSEAPPEGNA